MYTDILRSIVGIEVFPIVSLVLFVAFFTGMLVWVMRIEPRRLETLANLPLDAHDGSTSAGDGAR
jgi:hypothetical protein